MPPISALEAAGQRTSALAAALPVLVLLSFSCAQEPRLECVDHGDCSTGQACVEGSCKEVECLESSTCDYGSFCDTENSFACVSGCQSDEDCLATQVCLDGECSTESCRNADLDCWVGEFCDTGDGECYTDESRTWCMDCTEHPSSCAPEGICYSFGDPDRSFCSWYCQGQSDCPAGFTCTAMDQGNVCMADCSFLVDAGWLPPDPTRNSSGSYYGLEQASGCACRSAGGPPAPAGHTLPVMGLLLLTLCSRHAGSWVRRPHPSLPPRARFT